MLVDRIKTRGHLADMIETKAYYTVVPAIALLALPAVVIGQILRLQVDASGQRAELFVSYF